ncbi:Chemotaxis response regulator protein-glutamate methylesterase CheB [Alkalibacterium sp. AK22]|uniref:protein-glutamate methylesterase/protein-glutamine glutaminase n=1 Tax=Alkalibacterium sp. AK22 TaxID=1229520 RepID=UPI00044821EF|nr:chemotaxis response regulator protein-glutamate methylesterase [Alkalibacterium sp. AK22]EXJ22361.1 Chemotaxis response regulator protein-glutamate methylesterase CheB [Alkalibacterium sp. AK22]
MRIKVLVVDDSALLRKVVSNVLKDASGIEVSDVARNGAEALKLISQNKPDLVTLDVEMPVMNGLETLKAIKERYKLPVIMLSSRSNEEITLEALELGAEDFIEKPASISRQWDRFRDDLGDRIRVHFTKDQSESFKVVRSHTVSKQLAQKKPDLQAIVMGASTGGPKALVKVIQSVSANLPFPIFIVQHMPEGFTRSFAQRLDKACKVQVQEAAEGMKIRAGDIYLAPGGRHMTVKAGRIYLDERDKVHGVRPAVDYLFESAADTYGKNLLAIVMTGMGSDGAPGSRKVRQAGGYVLTQDKASSTVYGMPRAVAELGLSNQTVSLEEIAQILKEMTG